MSELKIDNTSIEELKKNITKIIVVLALIMLAISAYIIFGYIYINIEYKDFFKNLFIFFSVILSPLVIGVIVSETSFLKIPILNYIYRKRKVRIFLLIVSFILAVFMRCFIEIELEKFTHTKGILLILFIVVISIEIDLIYTFSKYIYSFNSKERTMKIIVEEVEQGHAEKIIDLCKFNDSETFKIFEEFDGSSLMKLLDYGHSRSNYSIEYCKVATTLRQKGEKIDSKYNEYLIKLYINNREKLEPYEINSAPSFVKLEMIRSLND